MRRVGIVLGVGAFCALASCGTSDNGAAVAPDAGPDVAVTDAGEDRAEAGLPPPIVCPDATRLTPFPADETYAPYVRAISPPKYQHGRCELVALLVDAALSLHETMPEKLPFGVADLSQADGAIPGTDVGSPRHPAPSHAKGFSVDVTYFRLNGKTLEDSPACPSKTREFCQGAHDVDVVPTARLMAHIARTKRVVQIIVDPMIEKDIGAALDGLSGVEGASVARGVLTSGVPFHADHFHVSVSRACYDGRDNDGDGKTDLDDPQCVDAVDDDEGS